MFFDLIPVFVKIGLLSVGGGYAQIALLQKEVLRFGIGAKEFVDIIAIAEMTPGPIGLNASTYTGYKTAGIPGAFAATCANVIPTLFLMLAAVKFVHSMRGREVIDGCLIRFRPVVIGLIASAAVMMACAIGLPSQPVSAVICFCVFLLVHRFKVHPIAAIIGAGLYGFLVY